MHGQTTDRDAGLRCHPRAEADARTHDQGGIEVDEDVATPPTERAPEVGHWCERIRPSGAVAVPWRACWGIPSAPELTPRSIRSTAQRMRTTLDIPEPLIEEARRLLGFKSKTDTVVLSLKEMIRRKRIEELKDLLGSVHLDIDIPKSRRRSPRRS